MPFARALSLITALAACTEVPDTEGPATEETPTPATSCAAAPMGPLAGTAVARNQGSDGFTETSAQVTWTLVASDGCVDRYQPAGTVTFTVSDAQELPPLTAPIDAADGELIVDRTAMPRTYTMHGASRIGGAWTDHEGTFDGDLIAGGLIDEDTAALSQRWRFTRDGAAFPPPADCAGAAIDRWTTVSESGGTQATVTWTRTGTAGCVDTFTPSGTARALPRSSTYCTISTFTPDSAPIGAGDGTLTIDRTTAPPTFRIDGTTSWAATWHCTKASGTVESEASTAGGPWGGYAAEFDGAAFGGAFEDSWGRAAWRFIAGA